MTYVRYVGPLYSRAARPLVIIAHLIRSVHPIPVLSRVSQVMLCCTYYRLKNAAHNAVNKEQNSRVLEQRDHLILLTVREGGDS